jgi:hypothetical protein
MIAVLAEIRETLNNLILKAPQEWHTQVALPFVKIGACTCPQHCSCPQCRS